MKGKKRQNLDQLMKAKGNEFTGSFGRDEFDEYKSRMAQEFLKESDKAIRDGDHVATIGTINRVFADVDEDISRVKQEITEETGMLDPNAEEEEEYPEGYSIDEDGLSGLKMRMATGGIVSKAMRIGNLMRNNRSLMVVLNSHSSFRVHTTSL